MGENFAGPVVLATLGDRPLGDEAVAVAVEIAREHGTWLAVVDLFDAAPGSRSGLHDIGAPPPTAASMDDAVARARDAEVPVATMRGMSLCPSDTLVRLVLEHDACLLVFGTEPGSHRLARRRHRRIVRRLERGTPCLLWTMGFTPPAPRDAARRAARTVADVARHWPASSRRPW
jgi:hypothetical protein